MAFIRNILFTSIIFSFMLASCAKDHIATSASESISGPLTASLEDVKVEVIDGVLHFSSVHDFEAAFQLFSSATGEELDEWGERIGFFSWGAEMRALQNTVEQDAIRDPRVLLDAALSKRYYFDEDNWLYTHASDQIMSEFMDTNGIVVVENHLHHFHRDHHIILEEISTEKLQEIKISQQHRPEEGVYFFPKIGIEAWYDDLGEGVGRASKYVNCPYLHNGAHTWGHRKEEQIGGRRHRLVVELKQNVEYFPGTNDNLILAYIGLDIENRKRSGWKWIGTFPDFEFGTLRAGSLTGAVDANIRESDLRVDRWISATVWRQDIGTEEQGVRFNNSVPMSVVNLGFREARIGVKDVWFLMDNVSSFTNFGLPNDGFIQSVWSNYGLRQGKISVNWLGRGRETMDIQLGCQ